jgi:molybdopterin-containing oxidoreductase family iron-sulfur binding subunit
MKLSVNPNVTLRGRGVMEKCSMCVQRINAARITAKKEDRTIRDGEIQTACQQACPTHTIIFGNISDPQAEVSKLKAQPQDYSLLYDLDTRPRVTYLARVKNPNPALAAEAAS